MEEGPDCIYHVDLSYSGILAFQMSTMMTLRSKQEQELTLNHNSILNLSYFLVEWLASNTKL